MLFEFALLPEVFEEVVTAPGNAGAKELADLLKLMHQNAMLADLKDRAWRGQVFDWLSGATGHLLDVQAWLNRLSDDQRLVAHPTVGPADNQDWLAEALAYQARCHLDGIWTGASTYSRAAGCTGVHSLPMPPTAPAAWRAWEGKRSRALRKCAADLRAALAPVLRHARKVYLIDPWFNCHKPQYRASLALVMDLLTRGTAPSPLIEIHAGDPERPDPQGKEGQAETAEARAKAWSAYLHDLHSRRSVKVRVFLWGERELRRFHNRAIHTDQHVGITVQDGLACFSTRKASTDSWDLKDEVIAQAELRRFTDRPEHDLARCYYELLDRVEVQVP